MKVLDKLVEDMNELADKSNDEVESNTYKNVCHLTEEYENILLDNLTSSALNLLENAGICKGLELYNDTAQLIRTQIKLLLNYPELTSKDLHDMWVNDMKEQGYTYGDVYSTKYKTHPNLTDYHKLNKNIYTKDTIIQSLVQGFK